MPWNGKQPPSFKRQKQRADRGSAQYPGYQFNIGVATRRYKHGNQDYITGGWSVVQPDQYTKNPTRPEMVEVRLFNGRKSFVPIGDVEQFIGYASPTNGANVTSEMAAYANAAFEKVAGVGKYYVVEAPEGHIQEIRYNPTYQVMDVMFRKRGNQGADTSVLFFRVPMAYWVEFQHHATSMATSIGFDGTRRHVLGIRFWDLIRIRGQRSGSRLEYTYERSGSLSSGSEQGKYVETALARMAPQAQQPLEASKEATVTNKEEPPVTEQTQINKEVTQREIANTVDYGYGLKYNKQQSEDLNRWGDVLVDKFSPRSPAYREFMDAIDQGYGAVLRVAKLYKLQ